MCPVAIHIVRVALVRLSESLQPITWIEDVIIGRHQRSRKYILRINKGVVFRVRPIFLAEPYFEPAFFESAYRRWKIIEQLLIIDPQDHP